MQVQHDECVEEKETSAKQMDKMKAKWQDYDDRLAERDNANSVLKDQLAKSEVDREVHESTLLVVRAELEATKVQLNEREEQYERQMEETLARREEVINSLSGDKSTLEKKISHLNAQLAECEKTSED